MYKDFKKTESLDTGLVGGNGLLWMFSGIVLGLFAGLGMYYFSNNPNSSVDTVQQSIEKAQLAKTTRTAVPRNNSINTNTSKNKVTKKEESLTKFNYYAILPTIDVPDGMDKPVETRAEFIPNSRNVEAKAGLLSGAVEEEVAQSVSAGNFLLQVASYRKQSKANITKGRLSKRGVDAYVQKKKIKGKNWYRVVAGPVDQISVASWKQTAEKLGHRPLVHTIR